MKARYWIPLGLAAVGAALWVKGKRYPRRYRLELPDSPGAQPTREGSILFIGTATTLIRFAGLTVLTDPNFLHRGEQVHTGFGMHATRLTNPAVEFEDLPPIDFVLLSHLHEDHFDKKVERSLARDIPILTTASAARILRRRGFTRTCPLRTWDSVRVRRGPVSLRITSMPGRHGPLLFSALMPDVMGSFLEFRNDIDGAEYRIYISGDTLVFRDLLEIPRRYPTADLALLHLGGTRVMGILVTMDAAQGIEAVGLIGADLNIPLHYDDYDVFRDPLRNFARAAEAAGLRDRVRYLERGETFTFTPRAVETPGPVPVTL